MLLLNCEGYGSSHSCPVMVLSEYIQMGIEENYRNILHWVRCGSSISHLSQHGGQDYEH